jgi:hypothetical protein
MGGHRCTTAAQRRCLELYDTNKDWSQAHDLAKQMSEKVAELKQLFEFEAMKYQYNFLGMLALRCNFNLAVADWYSPGANGIFVRRRRHGKGRRYRAPRGWQEGRGGHVGRTQALFFSMDETMEVGCDVGEPVSPDYGPHDNDFNGKIKWVQIDIDTAANDADRIIGAEERFNLAIAGQ